MKAAVYDKSAGPDALAFRDVEAPVPRDGEVMGDLSSCGFGALAEYATAPEGILCRKPAGLSFPEAAAIPLASGTALQGLRDAGACKAGDRVLVVGASGGVGTFAVQLASHFGAQVHAVCSAANAELASALGAARVYDYEKEPLARSAERYDLILAVHGNQPLSVYKNLLREGGRCVLAGGSLSQILRGLLFGKLLSTRSKSIRALAAKPRAEDTAYVARLAEEGKIKPFIEKTYPLDRTAEAFRYVAGGHARGKVVVAVGDA